MKRLILITLLTALCLVCHAQDSSNVKYEYAIVEITGLGRFRAYYENAPTENLKKIYNTTLGIAPGDSAIIKLFFVGVQHMREKNYEFVSAFGQQRNVSSYIFRRRRK